MNIIVYYGTTEVARHHVNNPFGCRLFYCPDFDKVATLNLRDPISFHLAFGNACRSQINLPAPPRAPTDPETQTDRDLIQLLEGMKRGLLLDIVSNDIFATKLCRCAVYCSDSRLETSEEGKLKTRERTKVFDYTKRFDPYFQQHCESGRFCPSSELYLTFGQPWSAERPVEECVLSIAVVHSLARSQIQARSHDIPQALSGLALEIEEPDEADECLVNVLKRAGVNGVCDK